MDIPKLKLPPKGFTVDDSYDSAHQQGTLAQIVKDAILEQNKKLKVPYAKGDSNRQRDEKACKAFNESFQKTRELIDTRVQEYLLSHEGEAGSWPDSTSVDSIEWSKLSTLEFDYFGDEYEAVEKYGISFLHRKSENFVYRNTYEAPDSPSFADIAKKEKELREALDQAKKERTVIMPFLFLLLAVYLVFAFVSLLGNEFWGTDETILHPMIHSLREIDVEGVLGTLRNAFCSMLNFPGWLRETIRNSELLGPGYSVIMFLLCAALAVGGYLAGGVAYYSFKDNLVYAKTRRQYEKFFNKEEYKRGAAENAQWREKAQALSDEWHKAWFRWVQIHKGGVGVTRMRRLLERSRAMDLPEEEKKMREQVREDLGLRIPDDTNALVWWKLFDRRTDTLVVEYAENGETSFDELSNSARTRLVEQVVQEMVEEGLAEYI